MAAAAAEPVAGGLNKNKKIPSAHRGWRLNKIITTIKFILKSK